MKPFVPFFLFLLVFPASALELPVAKPVTGAIHRWITLPGTLAAMQQTALHARVSGYVKSISVDKGDAVKAGQLLAQIEVPELQADLIKTQAEVTAAEIQLKRLNDARQRESGIVTAKDVDDAEARLAIAKATHERSVTLLDFAQIKAPFDGVITGRMVDTGAYVAPAGGALVNVADARTLRCQIPVTELESPLVHTGSLVKVTLEAFGAKPIEATITRTAHALDETTRTMLAEADLSNADLKLPPGMYASVKIAVEKHDHAVLIPIAGLVLEKTNAFVFKLVGGKAVKTSVVIGFNDGTNVEVPALKPEDVILLPGTTLLTDGQSVTAKS